MPSWSQALKLNENREVVAGSADALCDAIRRGADLRIGTAFRHNEHIDVTSTNNELIREVMDFRVTYLLEDRWAAGIQNLRMPIALPDGFGPRASDVVLSLQPRRAIAQGLAAHFLDGEPANGTLGPAPLNDHADMPKYHELANWDADTNAPSSNFIYDFEYFEYHVRDCWREVFAHDANGQVISGNWDTLTEAVRQGSEVEIARHGLCDDLAPAGDPAMEHEVFRIWEPVTPAMTPKRGTSMASANPVVRPALPPFRWAMPVANGISVG